MITIDRHSCYETTITRATPAELTPALLARVTFRKNRDVHTVFLDHVLIGRIHGSRSAGWSVTDDRNKTILKIEAYRTWHSPLEMGYTLNDVILFLVTPWI